jgi:hypothetical protein
MLNEMLRELGHCDTKLLVSFRYFGRFDGRVTTGDLPEVAVPRSNRQVD